ncbi:MAG: hypothetical protein KKB51_17615 [Candidatus Riflebacteria bacterium]|nr:hypothetical protein [Candidatus Riflebacteria bacterium]
MDNGSIIKNIKFYYCFALMQLLLGLAGITIGLYALFVKGGTASEMSLNSILLLFSVAIVGSSIIHYLSLKTIDRLTKQV